ncbi:DUF2971 domain-containing protein [Rhizobium rhizogenes]|uniref:DUF2971 domain-containing protein n=1 Tax=Rhizobium rhizogenes TaxID=359 RepID=UPI0012965391|nr:DUF2971 domain-containing protein [Rhizobium rhizogenes]MQB34741.1 DUF2971 domain-containing protein [Rhizobium rhizogenes]
MSFEDWAEHEIAAVSSGLTLRVPSRHQSMFKYIGLSNKTSWEYFGRMLNEFELVGSTAASLNDPFELSPFIFDDLRPKVVAQALDDRGYSINDRLQNKPPYELEEKYSDLKPHREAARAYLSRTERNSRIICFCERSDSPLLWSHYANSYKGACLHFFGRAFTAKSNRIGYVNYTAHRPTFPMSLALALSAKPQQPSSLLQMEAERMYFFSKALDWSYENEMRIVYNTSDARAVSFGQDGLASIIMGPRMSQEDQERLRNVVAQSAMPHLPIRQAHLSANSYSVEIERSPSSTL